MGRIVPMFARSAANVIFRKPFNPCADYTVNGKGNRIPPNTGGL